MSPLLAPYLALTLRLHGSTTTTTTTTAEGVGCSRVGTSGGKGEGALIDFFLSSIRRRRLAVEGGGESNNIEALPLERQRGPFIFSFVRITYAVDTFL